MLLSVVMGNVPMPHYGVRRSVLVNLDLEVRVCFQQSLLHCPREPSADSLIPSNQSTTFIQTFISCHLDPLSATNLCYGNFISYTELAFLIPFFLRIILHSFRSNASIIIYFPSGVKPRTTASSSKP